MSILKKFLVGAMISTALVAQGANAAEKKIALVVKALGIGFFEAAADGAKEAAAIFFSAALAPKARSTSSIR